MHRLFAVLVLVVAGLRPALGADEAPTPQPLSLTDAIAIATRHNATYLASATDVDAASAQAHAARAPRGPSVSVEDAFQTVDPVAQLQTPLGPLPFSPNTTNVPLVAAKYTLYDGGATSARVARADAQLAAARADQRESRSAAVARVGSAYYDLAAAAGEAVVADHAVALATEHERLARERYRFGMAAHFDVLQAQEQLADAQMRALTAHDAIVVAANGLDAALGVPLDTRFRPTDPLDAPVPDPALPTLLTAAEEQRGELAAARAAVVAARQAVDEAKAARAPRVDVGVSEGNVQPPVQPGFRAQFTFALTAVWKLFDNGASAADVAAAEAGVRHAALAVDALQSQIDLEVRQAYAGFRDARARVTAASALVALTTEDVRLAEIRYRGGIGTQLELRDVEQRDTAARQALVDAQAALHRNLILVRAAAGLM